MVRVLFFSLSLSLFLFASHKFPLSSSTFIILAQTEFIYFRPVVIVVVVVVVVVVVAVVVFVVLWLSSARGILWQRRRVARPRARERPVPLPQLLHAHTLHQIKLYYLHKARYIKNWLSILYGCCCALIHIHTHPCSRNKTTKLEERGGCRLLVGMNFVSLQSDPKSLELNISIV